MLVLIVFCIEEETTPPFRFQIPSFFLHPVIITQTMPSGSKKLKTELFVTSAGDDALGLAQVSTNF